ncbi:hypothetical protein GQR58_004087 [Nymphon striatum]|nr:hypothetical protein GQR58_004087 [Nymphon striatum]
MNENILILTDSLSSILAIQNFDNRHRLVNSVIKYVDKLDMNNCKIYLEWVKSHSGNALNDKVDLLAKQAKNLRGNASTAKLDECIETIAERKGTIATIEEYNTNGEDGDWDKFRAGAMIIHSKLGHYHYVYRPKYGDAFYVNKTSDTSMCNSYTMNDPVPGIDPLLQWNWVINSPKHSVVGPTALVSYLVDNKNKLVPTLKGHEKIRGIETTSYEFNMKGVSKDDFSFTVYFQDRWTTPSFSKARNVIRITMKGKFPSDKKDVKGSIQLNTDYDFINTANGLNAADRRILDGEVAGADMDAAEQWRKEVMEDILKSYPPNFLYNADET